MSFHEEVARIESSITPETDEDEPGGGTVPLGGKLNEDSEAEEQGESGCAHINLSQVLLEEARRSSERRWHSIGFIVPPAKQKRGRPAKAPFLDVSILRAPRRVTTHTRRATSTHDE